LACDQLSVNKNGMARKARIGATGALHNIIGREHRKIFYHTAPMAWPYFSEQIQIHET
jgi:hypothetical protein